MEKSSLLSTHLRGPITLSRFFVRSMGKGHCCNNLLLLLQPLNNSFSLKSAMIWMFPSSLNTHNSCIATSSNKCAKNLKPITCFKIPSLQLFCWHSTKLCQVVNFRGFPGGFQVASFRKPLMLASTLTWTFVKFLQELGSVPISGHMCYI